MRAPSGSSAAGRQTDDVVDVSFFDVLRAILFVALGHASNPCGLWRIAAWVSRREARRVASARRARVRRSPGIGVNRKVLHQGRGSNEWSEGVAMCARSGGVPVETLGDGMLRVAVAWTAYVTCAPTTSVATLAADEATVGPWETSACKMP